MSASSQHYPSGNIYSRNNGLKPLVVLALILLLLRLATNPTAAQTSQANVPVLRLEGVVDPITAGYITRGIDQAERDGAALVVITMDTPGGLDSSMRQIVQRILSARVPVAVYVSPAGARAASAGVFIAAATNVLAMAPGTNIGAAHPVGMGSELTGVLNDKATNDAVAYVQSIGELRGRDIGLLEDMVRQSTSLAAGDAVQEHVADLVAPNLPQLLAALDGRQAQTAAGAVTIHTSGASVVHADLNPAEVFLHAIVDPSIAYVLLWVGVLALLIELWHPGVGAPGLTGIISLALALVALGTLPVNWVGVGLIALAMVLIFLEVHIPGTSAFGIGGLIAFVLGSLMLFSGLTAPSPTMPAFEVNPWLVGSSATMMGAALLALAYLVRKARRARSLAPETTAAALVGKSARVESDLAPVGSVLVGSESWSARSRDGSPIRAGEEVRVVAVDNLVLIVER